MLRQDAREKGRKSYSTGNRNGFTLIEMIVTLSVLLIMLSLSAFGLLAWQDWANFKRENEYAQILYIAAQNQLTEFAADGRLQEMQESLAGPSAGDDIDNGGKQYDAVGLNLTDSISNIKNQEGEAYALDTIYPESAGKQNEDLYQDEIVSLRAETGDYNKYLDDPEGLKASDPEAYWVFELLGAYVYDTSILNGSKEADGSGNGATICVEITPEDGQVFSVLYSDKNDKFIYLGISGDEKGNAEEYGVADIANRTESYRKERMVGYYGVDTLYAATKNEVIQPSFSSVKLYNKDTFYMTYRLSAKYKETLTSQLTYVMDLNASKNVNDKKLTVTLDGTKLKNAENAEAISCPVSRYDEDGNEIELGEFPVLAWVENDYTIHVVLDAADIQATTDLYESELDDIRSDDKASDTKFAKTYSFFRFGVEADNVYASVTATGEGFTTSKTISNFGNVNIFKNQEAKHTTFAGESESQNGDGTDFVYSIKNARHLYNIRYIEDISYEKEAGDVVLADQISSVTFMLKSDIDWKEFEQNGQLYNSYDTAVNIELSSLNNLLVDSDGNYIENVTRFNCDFPSISQVRERDVIDGNHKKITGISVSEISNALYGVYFSTENNTTVLDDNRPTGFVNVNYGEIKDLKLDKIMAAGSSFVGGFCGINAGEMNGLETMNTDDASLIMGKKHVGGITGFQIPTETNLEIKGLVNRAQVEGVEAVGGIMGMIRNDFQFSDIDLEELGGLSPQEKQLLDDPSALTVKIYDCENYGAIAGVNSSELRGVYTAKSSQGSAQGTTKQGADDVTEPRYIGGIVGYCYNQNVDDTTKITIENCTSAPQYDSDKLLTILSDKTELNRRLKGVYVGGIVGYNYFGQINNSSTKTASGQEGYLFGYRYVGGIVGFNIGPASGIVGSGTSEQGENNNHVIAYEYAGGITGCNANVRDVDSENRDISGKAAKDPEKLVGLLVPDAERNLHVKIDNWVNKGIVIAVHAYSGGITGYNAGYIYRCNSDVKSDTANTYFATLYSGDYSGGIAGYNNGVIGNTERMVSEDGKNSTIVEVGTRFSTVCYVKGHNYVGGIVGYNDVDSIVEDYEVASGYVLGDEGSCFVGGYAGLNASVDLLMNMSTAQPEARFIHSNPNWVKGSYFVGGNVGGNIINMADNSDVDRINGVFMTDNFLGILEGEAFVGGFVGYNLLFDNAETTSWVKNDAESYRGAVYIVQRELIDAFERSDAAASGTEATLRDKKEILDNLPEQLNLDMIASDKMVYISGQGTDSTKVSFGTISADIYVGGVMGYNDNNTRLYIQNVENATSIKAMNAIEYVEEQVLSVDGNTGEKTYRTTDYIGNDMDYTYSYTGGIIGKVGKKTVLDNCWNASSGAVTSMGTYTGGLCEINEGTIKNCTVSSFGSSVQDYVGGLCGLNKSLIEDCNFDSRTVSGRNVVGGITAENFGTISDIYLSKPALLVEGKVNDTQEKDGVAGIYTGYNGITGKIILKDDISDVSITSSGKYVGAVVGVNEGVLDNQKTTTTLDPADNLIISGTVLGYQTVGGLIGLNKNPNAAEKISGFTNQASVTATNGNAGGIVGENQSQNSIQNCVNNAIVTATDEGNAGGITAVNNSLIINCYDYQEVSAPEGMCGGITAVNKEKGIIRECYVEAGDDATELTFRSTKAVGAVAAQNAGEISDNTLKNIKVTNETTVQGTSIGIIVGDNLDTGKIYLSDNSLGLSKIEDCQAVVQSNYSKVGGVAGTNAGIIQGTVRTATEDILSVVDCRILMDNANIASIGGVAGTNMGEISDIAVDADIQGNLGSDGTGYGGIAGCSGYTNKTALANAQQILGIVDYSVTITNCTFDGTINAIGSSGAPVRVGGIVGINGYNSKIEKCYIGARSTDADGNPSDVTYVTAGDYVNKTADSVLTTDTQSYSYTGGIAGDNYGWVSACDNAEKSTDTVNIIAFAGETGGIVGYNYTYGIVSGYLDEDGKTEHYLTTGKTWIVEQRCCGNDRGPGGIIGKSVSAEDMSYVINYAPITCNYQSNTYAAGLIGILEQQYALKTRFEKCENYGEITSFSSAGGLIGMLKGNGADFVDCNNWGSVYAKKRYSGGFVALHHSFTVGTDFLHCANNGNIVLETSENSGGVGGFIGAEALSLNATSYLYDCVNTGIIEKGTSTAISDRAGNFYGESNSTVYMELCRNYNTNTGAANGFVGKGGSAWYRNCFDDSDITTTNLEKTPFGGNVGNNANMFYLDPDSESTFSHKDYGVYFGFHEGANANTYINGMNYAQIKNPSYMLSEPGVSTKIYFSNKNVINHISLTYDDDSQGLDSFVIYFWNNGYKANSAPQYTFNCTATFTYSDGTKATTDTKTAVGSYALTPESKVVLENPKKGQDDKPISIQLTYSGTSNICLRGFSYVPVAESGSRTEAACTYLGNRNDTTFSIENIQRTTSAGVVTTSSNFSVTKPANTEYRFINEAFDIDWSAYSNYRLQYNSGDSADITFEVTNGENASGMDSFVFYLANNNTSASTVSTNIRTYYYDYAVTFTDINGNTATTDMAEGVGYDSGESDYMEKSKQVVAVPDGLDSHITSIQLHIKFKKYTYKDGAGNIKEATNTGYIYFRGFGWIPEGQTAMQKMAAGVHSSATQSFYDRGNNSQNYYTQLMIDNSGSQPYVYLPYNYNQGFYMTYDGNDPIGDTYYFDLSDYSDSVTAGKNSGSRIDTYLDIDPKFVALTEEVCTVYQKLSAPKNLKMTDSYSSLHFSWNKVLNAYGYEVYYTIQNTRGDTVFTSDVASIGSLQLTYNVEIDNQWAYEGNRIVFYVRAINAYHPAHDDVADADYDSEFDKYDSDWASIEGVTIKKTLPKPQVHMEIVAGNRTTFVLDNYEEYVEEGCTDCTIVVQYNGKDYSWNVAETGKYRIPQTVSAAQTTYTYYAKPNEALQEMYTTSAIYRQFGEGHGNNNLPNSDCYCSTSFNGFYGTEADSMEYRIVFTLSSLDTYLMTDITAYDEAVGATVVYDSEITHAANSYSGGGTLKLTSTLKNLPEEWFAEDKTDKITVRAYPYHSQYDMIYYGHDVAEGIKLDGTVEENRAILADIYDDAYFAADADAPVSNCIWDAQTNDLKSGYLLQKQEDGTYNVIYSSVIELSQTAAAERREVNGESYREYYKYDVYYRIYSDMAVETADAIAVNSADFQESYWSRALSNYNTYYNTTTNSNELKYVQEVQAAPIVENEVLSTVDENGHTEYTFKWDTYYQDTACWNGSIYNNNNMKYLTNADAGLFATWDAYCEKFNQAGLANTVPSNSDGTARSNMLRLMNAYYNSYSTASYRVDLIGTTLDGKEVVLDTINVDSPTALGTMSDITEAGGTVRTFTTRDGVTPTTYNVWDYECTFTDSNDVWGTYPKLTARIMRLGSLSSVRAYSYNNGNARTDANGATYILPRYTDKSIQVKLKMNTISKPTVSLLMENGQYITDDLVYEVKWGAITDQNQKQDLGGYLITVKLASAADENQRTQTHYYYVSDIQNGTDTIGLDIAELQAQGVVTDVTGDYTKEDNACTTRINLSDFNTDDIVEISVKAIARTNAENYTDSADGVKTELTIPARLKVPDVSKLGVTLADGTQLTEDTQVTMTAYKTGFAFQYSEVNYTYDYNATDEIAMAVAIYDSKPSGAESGTETVETAWNTGAINTLYSKDVACILGKVSEGNVKSVDITAFENYPGEYAGKWMKIALQATNTTEIDSQWTDQDLSGRTVNYVWVPIPKLQLDNVNLTEGSSVDTEDEDASENVIRYYYDGTLYNESQDSNREIQVASKTLCFSEDKNVDGYRISIVGKKPDEVTEAPVYDLYLQRHLTRSSDVTSFDGTWDVYLAADGVTADPEQQSGKPVCEQNPDAVWIGVIGNPFDSDTENSEGDLHLIDIPELGKAFTIVSTTYTMTAQLRYVEDTQTGDGSFLIVLPDITRLGETTYDVGENYFTSKVTVSQNVKPGTAYTHGNDGIYERR